MITDRDDELLTEQEYYYLEDMLIEEAEEKRAMEKINSQRDKIKQEEYRHNLYDLKKDEVKKE